MRTAEQARSKHGKMVVGLTGSNDDEVNVFPNPEIEEGDQGYGLMEVLENCFPSAWTSDGREALLELGFNITEEDELHVYTKALYKKANTQDAEKRAADPHPEPPMENKMIEQKPELENTLPTGKEVCFPLKICSFPCSPTTLNSAFYS